MKIENENKKIVRKKRNITAPSARLISHEIEENKSEEKEDLPDKPLERHRGSQASRQQGTAHSDSLQGSVEHLATVAAAAALEEVGHVVTAGEGRVGDVLAEELAQRAPAFADLVLEQALGGHQGADQSDVVLVDLLALVGEVAAEESLEELAQHRIVHAGGPAEVGDEAVFGVGDAPVDGLHDGSIGVELATDRLGWRGGGKVAYACQESTSRVVRMTLALG